MMINEYHSPIETRYSNRELSEIWSVQHTRILWRQCWARDLERMGTPIPNRFLDYWANSLHRAQEIEKVTHHDLVAELQSTQKQFPEVAHLLHLGMTSSDVVDYATLHQLRESMSVIASLLKDLLVYLSDRAYNNKNEMTMGRTHLLLAEPTIWGYRLLVYAQELLQAMRNLGDARLPDPVPLGAVGTRCNRKMLETVFPNLYEPTVRPRFARGQTYPRIYEYRLSCMMADIGSTIYKISADMRTLLAVGDIYITRKSDEIGSSAMPTKRNPITYENICSLARRLPGISRELWDISANSLLERTLDDSASRRMLLPEMFLLTAHIITSITKALQKTLLVSRPQETLAQHWETWTSSMVQSYLAVKEQIPVTSNREELERIAKECKSQKEFVNKVAPDLLPYLYIQYLSGFLSYATDVVETEAPLIAREAEELCELI